VDVLQKPDELIQKVIYGPSQRINDNEGDFGPIVLPGKDPAGEPGFAAAPRAEDVDAHGPGAMG
jgi:hypothetical protein